MFFSVIVLALGGFLSLYETSKRLYGLESVIRASIDTVVDCKVGEIAILDELFLARSRKAPGCRGGDKELKQRNISNSSAAWWIWTVLSVMGKNVALKDAGGNGAD